jgi:hypothetical protein
MMIRRIISSPLRFFRYIEQPAREMQARYQAMSEDEKAERGLGQPSSTGLTPPFPARSPESGQSTGREPRTLVAGSLLNHAC